MGGRAFGPPPHALPERGALVPRVASRVAPVGHSSVQHPGRFQPGKYYPSAVPMAPHSGSGLIGGSSFMGSFLASSLGSPPSHSAPPSGAPHSPSSPSLHSGPHSSPSQIWFPHQAPAGFPQFSGRIAHSFLPISHLDHHGNSSVLYGQHRYYDSQNDPFYLRSLPSQSSLISANHSFPPVPPGSCSHERDSGGGAEVGGGASLHKGLKEGGAALGPAPKEKERPSSKQEARERVQQAHAHLQPRPQHAHPQPRPLHAHPHQLPPLRPAPLQKDTPLARGKPLSACLLNEGGAQGSLSSCGAGVGAGPGMGGEMRISEQPCLERGGNPGGFPCPHPHPSEFYCPPPPPAPSLLTGPTFVPSVAPFGDRSSGPFQLGTPECRGLGAGGGSPGGNAKDRVLEKSGNHGSEGGNHGGAAPTGTCLRKQQQQGYSKAASDWLHTHQQLHVCSKVAPDWLQNHQQQHPLVDKPGPCTGPPPQQNCPHSQPPDGKGVAQFRTRAGGGAGGRVTLQQDVQNVARIRHQPPDPPPWAGGEEGHRKATRQHGQSEQEPGMASPPAPPTCMRSLLRHSSPQPPPPSQSAAFGGLGCLRSRGGAGGRAGGGANCSRQEDRQTLPTRKGSTNEEPRSDLGGRGREDPSHAEGEVRQPPVGIAVAVARQREPPCRPPDPHVRPGMGHSVLKGARLIPHLVCADVCQGKRRRVCEDALSSPCLERERELFIRENKERIDYSRIHPSSSCHSDLASHLMMVGGTSLHASQLGADPATHAHAPHHHWMPRTGSPSLWMTGHSYGIGHLHQNLPPGFSAAMPSALQPVLPLPQDPSAQLVVLPTEPPTHPTSHPLEMIDQSGLWPSVFGAQVAHPSVYTRSQFLRQQELYTLQQQQRERVAQMMESQHRHAHSQVQRTLDDPPEPDAPRARPHSPKPAKPFSFTPSPPAGCPTRLSPCCHSPSLRPHPKSTPCPTPAPPPASHCPRSPALTPTPPHPSLDKRVEGQPPQDYPQSLEPDLPPEYTYSSIGYRRGPSPQDILLAEPADLEAVQVEPTPRPRPLPAVGAEPQCDGVFSPIRRMTEEAEPNAAGLREGVEGGGAEKYLGQEGEEPDVCSTVIEVCPTLAVTHGDDPPVTCRDGWGEPADEGVVELSDDEEQEEGTAEMETGDEVYLHLCPESTPVPHSTEETRREAVPDDHALPIPTSCPAPTCQATPTIWSLELLIAAALCGERDTPLQHSAPLPRPAHSMPCPAHTSPCPAHAPPCPGSQGMELLSEVADLELHYHESSGRGYGKDMLTFDLQSLATLAAARALELGAGEGGGDARRHRVPRRTLNLRRKFSWTPRHDPVSPVKIAMETMDGQEVAMRMQLADLQRRYKEKQRELAKLQRKHEHQKQEASRSPVRRGPGRPRKRKSTPSAAPTLAPKRARSLGAGLGQLMDDLRGSVSSQRKEKTLSNQVWDQLHTAQSEVPVSVGCMPAQPVFQLLKQKAAANGGAVLERGFHRRAPGPLCTEGKHSSTARGHGNTALAGRGAQEGWVGQMLMLRRNRTKALQTGRSTGKKQEVADTSHTESESSQREEDSSPDSDKEHYSKATSTKDSSINLNLTGPSPSSVVKLEANQKAKNKKERQGLLGSVRVPCMEEVKVRRRTPYGPAMGTTQKRFLEPEEEEEEEEEGEEGEGGKRCKQLCQQGSGLQGSLATSRRLKKLTASIDRVMAESHYGTGPPHRETHQVLPSCVLSKEQLVDGLKVLISKEDELLYAAYLRTLDLPDIYSVVIEGERRNRPRIYSLEQLLQEAVLDVRPESELMLEQGARVCAYWSERSRCLYPGYVHRGGPGEQQKEGSVMVEFDDGDRGWISLHNIRLLPPGYQIRCAEPAPTLLMSACRRRRSFTLEKSTLTNTSSDRPYDSTAKPGIPDSVNSGRKCTPSESSCPPISWLAVTTPRRRTPHSFFPLNGAPRRALKRQEADFSPSLAPPTAPPAKPMFSSSFEVDSFRSIAHGCTSFSARHTPAPLGGGEGGRPCRGGSGCPVKLDHEGVTAPKTKSSKALLQHGGGKAGGAGFGSKGGVSSAVRYAPPVLLTKASKKGGAGGGAQVELLLGGLSQLHAPPQALPMDVLAEYDSDCHSDCHASYSDMEEEEEEEEHQRAAMAGHFLSRLSIFSSSSGSSSSSSSSLCSSSLCSSENDSSYSSEDEEGGPLLLQGCLSSHHALLQAPEPPLHSPPAARHSFGAKVADGNKPIRRKDGPDSTPSTKTPRDPARRQRQLPGDTLPKAGPYPSTHQLWKWSGNPTQRRGMKGKARKLFYKAVVRGRDTVCVGDCAVFLSAGRPHLPYVGRIESMWQSWASNMVVKVKWFYHPEETKMGKRPRDGKHALYQSSHEDENDVQTISHRCQVVSRAEYEYLSRGRKLPHSAQDLYYLAGTYDPASGQLVTAEGEAICC
ncbi:LOW QUALITY PROTEIN: BAH and coiled-coil domain-containing protein 1 [Anguilla rostrata]|uniref:LOW QUALITY PROTEIN: BAH and coiled-coil domain-containing protein 1 n=1 Tax=Anguilla rostrata TaxID=7938 RepID=UPI0030D00D47